MQTRIEPTLIARAPDRASLVDEVRRGLSAPEQPWLPAAWLYDDTGSALFDRICSTEEYYPTRTERRLLARVAPQIASLSKASELVELGSGHARKTHLLLEAMGASRRRVRYLPFDTCEATLDAAGERLTRQFPRLSVAPVQGDFTRDLSRLPAPSGTRLVVFLGGTIGNFEFEEARAFIESAARLLAPGDHLLLAADLVKPRPQLHAAYNDSEGLTAAFNLNALARLERELGARLSLGNFAHDAFFDETRSRIEMHARALCPTRITVPSLELEVELDEGRSIRTEISGKFTPERLDGLVAASKLEPVKLWIADPPYALSLSRRPF